MDEAVLQTSASPAAIWAIIVVPVVALAFWLTMINVVDGQQARDSRRQHAMLDAPGPVRSGSLPSGSVPAQRDAGIPAGPTPSVTPVPESVAARRPAETPQGNMPARPDMPAQRAGDTDRAQPAS
jgi:hypothetical protein